MLSRSRDATREAAETSMDRLDRKVEAITGAREWNQGGTGLCLAKEGAAVMARILNSRGGEAIIGKTHRWDAPLSFQHDRRLERTGDKKLPSSTVSRSTAVSALAEVGH